MSSRVILHLTSFLGSLVFIYHLGFVCGLFVNIFEAVDKQRSGEGLPLYKHILFCLIFVPSAVMAFFALGVQRKLREKDKYDYYNSFFEESIA